MNATKSIFPIAILTTSAAIIALSVFQKNSAIITSVVSIQFVLSVVSAFLLKGIAPKIFAGLIAGFTFIMFTQISSDSAAFISFVEDKSFRFILGDIILFYSFSAVIERELKTSKG